jgi:enoyl-CoA hydratase/carnithine racemase
MDRAEEIANKIARKSPDVIRAIKRGVIETSGMPLGPAHQLIMQLASALEVTPG